MTAMEMGYGDALSMPTSERRYHLMKKIQQKENMEAEAERRNQSQTVQTGKGKKVTKTSF